MQGAVCFYLRRSTMTLLMIIATVIVIDLLTEQLRHLLIGFGGQA